MTPETTDGGGDAAGFPRRLVLSIPSKFRYLRWARRTTQEGTRSFDLSPGQQIDLTLVASELVTNAIEHGAGGRVWLEILAERGSVEVTASSAIGDRLPLPTEQWSLPEPMARSGRGLAIIRQLCESVRVHEADNRLVITCRFPLSRT
ncbi:hypothetical protein BH20ACT4_BH20ACT4_06940 [soil metagenome]